VAGDVLTEEKILREQPRLKPDDRFQFVCGRSLDCFTHCCRDVSIVLTPYDILRLKRALGIDSSEFLDKYTISPFTSDQKFPVVLLKMDAESRRCPLVTEEGCSIYQHRPWACRMYPLGLAEPKNPNPVEQGFHFLVREELCHGHDKGDFRSVREWITEQGIEEYNMMGASFKELMLHDFWDKCEALSPAQVDMFYMACYDLDRFRRFVFETRFLKLFDIDETRIEALRTDDLELLDLSMQWLRFSLFQERSMKMSRSAREARKA
jgi:Fe-S-cluster containining protein